LVPKLRQISPHAVFFYAAPPKLQRFLRLGAQKRFSATPTLSRPGAESRAGAYKISKTGNLLET
jgi:hypothetical protein